MSEARYTRNLFLRGMSIIYMFAFASFYIQIPGLYGSNGVLPARTQLVLKGTESVFTKLMTKPTLLWFAPFLGLNVEYMMDVLALIGTIIAFTGFVRQSFCTAPTFAILWALYFSLHQVGQTFMEYQWDSLLLEAGVLAALAAPLQGKGAKKNSPMDSVSLFLVRWLFFRLMFSSGIVKLSSGCPTWWGLSALNVHFESQCIPTPLAWYAHHLPVWFLRFVTAFSILAEIVVPVFFFVPIKAVRNVAFLIQIFLQINIILTGNYNFFNLLTITLSLSLLDDDFFIKRPKSMLQQIATSVVSVLAGVFLSYAMWMLFDVKLSDEGVIETSIAFSMSQFDQAVGAAIKNFVYIGLCGLAYAIATALFQSLTQPKGLAKKILSLLTVVIFSAAALFLFAISIVPFSSLHPSGNSTVLPEVRQWYSQTKHLNLVDTYGLFRRMTGVEGRPEVVIEGSNSIEGPWKEYNFLYKPGNINSTLPFVAPYQPRLDWQMWFAALGTYHQNPWLMSLVYRLLSGQPEVLQLLDVSRNPFPNKPPRYIKASLYHYHYTTWDERWSSSWWTREKVGEYFPIFTRDHPPLLDYLNTMKVISPSYKESDPNTLLKFILDFIRSFVVYVEPSILIISLFITGCVLITTIRSSPQQKKRR
ncbi:Lipase maturation factor 2 [Frankliniella fusca]|uniref:Lipase maturation factor n=1 Tax=Frankliniella fusca TaxID=407009 RepID=A0AAE1HY35_9NEOP|nr:Lipase maturation factor 2 [Frankliniella fusca]